MKFDKNKVKPGARLTLVENPSVPMVFKGMGHGGSIVVSFIGFDGKQRDAILRQREVLIPDDLGAV